MPEQPGLPYRPAQLAKTADTFVIRNGPRCLLQRNSVSPYRIGIGLVGRSSFVCVWVVRASQFELGLAANHLARMCRRGIAIVSLFVTG